MQRFLFVVALLCAASPSHAQSIMSGAAARGTRDAFRQLLAERLARERPPAPNLDAILDTVPPVPRLLIFGLDRDTMAAYGGQLVRQYLGCLNCPVWDRASVRYAAGPFGSPISFTSLRNPVAQFGSPLHDSSACSYRAASPPWVVDDAGTFYGELTLDPNRAARLVQHDGVRQWLRLMCAH